MASVSLLSVPSVSHRALSAGAITPVASHPAPSRSSLVVRSVARSSSDQSRADQSVPAPRHVSRRREWLAVPLLSAGLAALQLAAPTADAVAEEAATKRGGGIDVDPENPLIKELLQRSQANKAKYDEERLNDYYRRNFKDYFEFVGGTLQSKARSNPDRLSANDKLILKWLEDNK
eukprot:TRINITY_DN1452_c0_g1_i3.p1 TRINITY_DN1452_c0_g1~~TRINITY_DN1452_c0_g1_i3.p1  ORF type:complete len:189 (+),score=0.65 TRINITY_DN1452_c0_g1_i3:42-569(+)